MALESHTYLSAFPGCGPPANPMHLTPLHRPPPPAQGSHSLPHPGLHSLDIDDARRRVSQNGLLGGQRGWPPEGAYGELKMCHRDPGGTVSRCSQTSRCSRRHSSLVCSLDVGPVATLRLQLPHLLKIVLVQLKQPCKVALTMKGGFGFLVITPIVLSTESGTRERVPVSVNNGRS